MPRRPVFQVVVATDGSDEGQTAAEAAARFPWPSPSDALVVAATGARGWAEWSPTAQGVARRAAEDAAARGLRALARRWPRARAACPARLPGEAILAEARSVGAGAIVVGFSGRGALGRLLMGSVSRHVVRAAACPVLVAKGSPARPRRFVIGVDGSDSARHAVDVVAALPPPPGGRVTLVMAIEPVRMPSLGLLPPTVRAALRGEAMALGADHRARAERELAARAARLRRAGWRVRESLQEAVPLAGLLAAARAADGDVLAVGARGTGGMARLLLGSVAEGAIGQAPMSVLVVR
jgi:nucleotide-binding universal stress UspA family protein